MSNNHSSTKVVVIGLDGATWDLLSPLIERGLLPNLGRVRARGVWGPLRSTVPPVTASAWITFQTGVNPEKHGIFDFMRYQPGSYETPLLSARDIPLPTLWQILGEAGRRVIAVNVPITYPPPAVNGVIVSGMLAPSTDVQYTHPPEIAQELKQAIGEYPLFTPIRTVETMGVRAFVDRLVDSVERRTAATLYLMAHHPWDLAMVHYQSTDILQHALYSHIDPNHPAHAQVPVAEREYALRLYRALDENVGQILDTLDGNAVIVFMSDHGFGPLVRRIYLNRLLVGAGLLGVRSGARGLRAVAAVETLARKLDVFKLRRRLLPAFSARDQAARQAMGLAQIDWPRTKAFALSGAVYGRIYVNRIGREAAGAVAAADYDRVRDEIVRVLSAARDPLNGGALFSRVLTREEAYGPGPRAELLPDVVVIPADGYMITETFRGDQVVDAAPLMLTGNHRPDGIVALAGPGIRAGATIDGASIADLAPTILHVLGVPAPAWMDGCVLRDAFSSTGAEGVAALPPYELLQASQEDEPVYSAGDQDIIEDRLRGLGYID